MEKMYTFKMITGLATAAMAWLSAKLGALSPLLFMLLGAMIVDYISGMMASKREAIDHPEDTNYGWSSKKGAKGVMKKFGYIFVIMVAMIADYIILRTATYMGIQINAKAFFGLMVTVWYLLNEILSIIENAGRMGTPVPEWLTKYIAVLKNKVDTEVKENNDNS